VKKTKGNTLEKMKNNARQTEMKIREKKENSRGKHERKTSQS